MKITRNDAIEMAVRHLNQNGDGEEPIVIMDEYTVEKPYGWIFSYNTKQFAETKDWKYSLIGGGPLIMTHEGAMHQLPSCYSKAEAIRRFEEDNS